MKPTRNLKLMLTPLLVGSGLFVFMFFAFITVYIIFEYQGYCSLYTTTQQVELKALQQKTDAAVRQVNELLKLTSTRIAASQNNLQRIQNILISSPRLYSPQELPNIQSVVYYMFSKPYKTISRFGIFPLDNTHPPTSQVSTKEPLVVFQDDAIISKIPVFDESEALKGILEIKIIPSELKSFLGEFKTLVFTPLAIDQERGPLLLQKSPFAIYAKQSNSFWQFAFDNTNRYSLFFCYTLLIVSLFFLSVFYLRWYFQKAYGHKIETVERHLAQVTEAGRALNEKLNVSEQKYKSCWISFQSYKKIYANLNNEKKEQALQIWKGLDVVNQGIKGSKLHYSSVQQFELIRSCLKFAHILSEGRILQKKVEKIDFWSLFEDVSSLFAEKIHKSKTSLDITCPEGLCFYGDPLLTEVILANIIGKAIYRLSRNGRVSIAVINQEKTIFVELRDKGFSSDDASEKAFKKSFDLFVPENILKKMCHENDLQYASFRDEKDFNITKIIIPKLPVKNIGNNVIKLFQ